MLREGEAGRAPAARTRAGVAFERADRALQPVEFVFRRLLVRALVKVAMQRELVTAFEQKVNSRRIFFDAPTGHEERLTHAETLQQPDEARHGDQWVVARLRLRGDEGVSVVAVV